MANNLNLSLTITAHVAAAKAALGAMKSSLSGLGASGNEAGTKTAGAFKETESQFSKTRQGLQSISEQLKTSRQEVIAFFSAQYALGMLKSVIMTADAYAGLQSRLKLAVSSMEEYNRASERLFSISQRTGTSMESNITLYACIASSMREMGKSQQDTLVFTEAVAQSMRLSGASAESAKAGITQLAQAMGPAYCVAMNSIR